MHGNIAQTPFAFIVGLVCATVVIRTRCIWLACAVHFLNNLMSVLLDYATRNMTAEDQQLVLISVFLLLSLFGLAAALLQSRRETAEPDAPPPCSLSRDAKAGRPVVVAALPAVSAFFADAPCLQHDRGRPHMITDEQAMIEALRLAREAAAEGRSRWGPWWFATGKSSAGAATGGRASGMRWPTRNWRLSTTPAAG